MNDYKTYLEVIEQNYAVDCQHVELLKGEGDRFVLKLHTPVEEFIVKVCTNPDQFSRVKNDLNFLNYMRACGLQCPRLLQTTDNHDWVRTGEFMLYLLHFIPGSAPRPTPQFFQAAGTLLGRLHQVPVHEQSTPSSFSLPTELPYIRTCMAQVEQWPDLQLEGQLFETLKRLEAIAPGRQTFIHTDFLNGNLVMTPDGELYLIDMDDAGIGDPLLDLGFFIGNGIILESEDGINCNLEYLEDFLTAYKTIRPLLRDEIEVLPDYTYFGIILYLCNPFQKCVWPAKVSRYRWLLSHEASLRQNLREILVGACNVAALSIARLI
ncbi:MAG: phosphotransferase [Anaerolineae bacterium]|nr:phosphotransferase [Anaerolineae bacterium]